MRRYLHVGFPKAVSTVLQRDFFDRHPRVVHLGVGCGGNVDYVNPDIELVVEDYLLFCKEFLYRRREPFIKSTFESAFDLASRVPGAMAVGISNESLAFGYTPGHVDTVSKARRLRDIFGPDTCIIMIVRNQISLLQSLYRESIRNGYHGSFNDFVHFAYVFQDRSFLADFLYDCQVELYSSLFSRGNVHVLPLEEYRTRGELVRDETGRVRLFDHLCGILGLPPGPAAVERHNDPLSPAELVVKESLNRASPHDLGHGLLRGVVNSHRLREYFRRHLQWAPAEGWLYDDVRRKRALIAQARAEVSPERGAVISYDLDPALLERVHGFYRPSNERLSTEFGVPLPPAYTALS